MRRWYGNDAVARQLRPTRLIALLAGALWFGSAAPEAAAAAERSSLVVDANSGRILQAQAADELRHPASLAKMMTLYIVFDLIEQGRLSPTTRIKVSEVAANTPPSRLGLTPDSELNVLDAVKALITKSANDVAVALAEHISGSEDKFARLMTQKARALGMHSTVFTNAHGLPDPDQVTTARDMAALALHLNDDFPRWYRLFSLRSFAYEGRNYRNHNTLLASFEGTDGIKTGYTASSGFNLVASVRRDGKHVVGVVFGGTTASSRNAYMRALLNRALVSASTRKTRQPMLIAQANSVGGRAGASSHTAPPVRRRHPEPQRDDIAKLLATSAAENDDLSVPKLAQSTPIHIARVRQVLVTPKSRLMEGATASDASTTASDVAPRIPFQRASAGPDAVEGRVFAPTGLQAQAERLARGQAAVDLPAAAHFEKASEAAETVREPAAVTQDFAIQIGAFSSESEAQRHLQAARGQAATLLTGRTSLTQPVQHAGRRLYRARFSGFDSRSADTTCAELRRLGVDCLVARPE